VRCSSHSYYTNQTSIWEYHIERTIILLSVSFIPGLVGDDSIHNEICAAARKSYSFYHHYLIPDLSNRATICWLDWTSNKTHFEITEIANQEEDNNSNNSKMLLVVMPLTHTKDKFLCIYPRMPSDW
jgi:hypothetical protein